MRNKFFIESYIRWSGIDEQGHMHADLFMGSKKQFKKHIKQKNILPTKVKHEFRFKKSERLTKSLHAFTKDLGVILSTGINLVDGLKMLTYRYTDPHIKNILSNILSQLHAGRTLSHALTQFPQFFSSSYIQLIQAGEMTQQLPHIFSQLASQQQFASHLKNKVKKALIYPACVLLFSLFITTGLIIFAIPQFKLLFENFNAQLPTSTQTILTIAHTIGQYKLLIVLLTFGIPCLLLIAYKKSQLAKASMQLILMHIPWINTLYRNKLIAHWSYTMSLSMKTHIPLPQAITLANATMPYIPLHKDCDKLVDLLNAGNSLYEALATIRLFLASELYLIRIGEQSHTLQQAFERLSEQAFQDIAHTLGNLSKWLEPVIMLILAVIAGGLIVSMYLPIFKIGAIL